MHYSEDSKLIILDSSYKSDRAYARENLIGSLVHYADSCREITEGKPLMLGGVSARSFYFHTCGWRFIAAAKDSTKETCTSCNKNTATTCDKRLNGQVEVYGEELSGKKEPDFYCGPNIDKLKNCAIGKKFEFSDNGVHWFVGVLDEIRRGSSYPFLSNELPGGLYIFIRPIQPKPIKHLSIGEAEEELGLAYSSTFGRFCGERISMVCAKERLSEKFNCEVVIDE